MWVQEDGKSKRHLVMRWIGDERTHRDPTRKRADFHLVSHHERIWQITKGGKADDGKTGNTTEQVDASANAGAASHRITDWHAIDWHQANRNVQRLQTRIVKATQEGKWGKVKALQRLLTHSFSGKALAVKRVTENQGKNTPGVDRSIWNTPQKKMNGVYSLRQRNYHPQPLRRIYIPKKNGEMRPLSIPCMPCRSMQALYLLALSPVAEVIGDRNSYGFRPERSTADAIAQCFTILAPKRSAQWILEGDIRACFDKGRPFGCQMTGL